MAISFEIIRQGNDFSARANAGPQFFVGRRVPYEGKVGLYNVFGKSRLENLNFRSADFTEQFGFWAEFIEPTAACEGRNFLTLNTYDRAGFTFGFAQFAAHVPNGDFVLYFRSLLQMPDAANYFPHLGLVNGRVCSVENPQAPKPLESDASTEPLMKYLNPDPAEVEDAEVIAAAKLIHWTSNSAAARGAQVGEMIASYKSIMDRAEKRVGVHGRSAALCCVLCDILHHGRGGNMTWPLVQTALASPKPFEALIAIGAPKWDSRKQKLKSEIRARPDFEALRWDRKAGKFA